MKQNNEIHEMEQFIHAFRIPEESEDYQVCLGRLAADIDEEFLRSRSDEVREAAKTDIEFSEALGNLSAICNTKTRKCKGCPVCRYCNTFIRNARKKVKNNPLQMVDLFCGAGGLSLGFTQEGFVTCLANDIQSVCTDTYAHNHSETPRKQIITGDIKTAVVEQIDALLDGIKPAVVVGGPPCQGFSMANRQRIIDDPRNKLYRNFVETVRIVQPPFFVMENVRGMLSVKDQVIEDFDRIGYRTSAHILNAKDFGVPQNRERLIYIGNRVGVDNEIIFSEIAELSGKIPDYYLKDALYGLRPLEALRIRNATTYDSEKSGRLIEHDDLGQTNDFLKLINQGRKYPAVLNHKARYNNDRDIEIFGKLNPGDKSTDPKIADIMPYSRRNNIFKDKYFKLEPDKVSKTITAHMKFDCNMYIHPSQARGLTPREAARIQSYPDDYFFRGAFTKTYMQIGNSVPPLLGRAIAAVLKKYIAAETD